MQSKFDVALGNHKNLVMNRRAPSPTDAGMLLDMLCSITTRRMRMSTFCDERSRKHFRNEFSKAFAV